MWCKKEAMGEGLGIYDLNYAYWLLVNDAGSKTDSAATYNDRLHVILVC